MQNKKKFIVVLCCSNLLGEAISSLKKNLSKYRKGKPFHLLGNFFHTFLHHCQVRIGEQKCYLEGFKGPPLGGIGDSQIPHFSSWCSQIQNTSVYWIPTLCVQFLISLVDIFLIHVSIFIIFFCFNIYFIVYKPTNLLIIVLCCLASPTKKSLNQGSCFLSPK